MQSQVVGKRLAHLVKLSIVQKFLRVHVCILRCEEGRGNKKDGAKSGKVLYAMLCKKIEFYPVDRKSLMEGIACVGYVLRDTK